MFEISTFFSDSDVHDVPRQTFCRGTIVLGKAICYADLKPCIDGNASRTAWRILLGQKIMDFTCSERQKLFVVKCRPGHCRFGCLNSLICSVYIYN